MKSGWKAVLGQVAPTLATALGGPLAGGVVKRLAGALLGDEKASEDKVGDAILRADPVTLLKLKELEQEYAKFVLEHDLNLEKLAVEDRGSARQREIATKDWVVKVLAIGVFSLFSAVVWALYKVEIPASNRDATNQVLGILYGAVSMVLGYYFGSSASSDRKTELIGKK